MPLPYTFFQLDNGKWAIEGKTGYIYGVRFDTEALARKWAEEREAVQAAKAAGKPVMFAGSSHRFGA